MGFIKSVFWGMILLCLVATSQAYALEKVSLKLQWLHQFQFAGYYVAKEKGFYKEAGLDVEIIAFEEGSQDVVNLVRSGAVDFGTGRASLVVDKLLNKPVVALAAIFQNSPSILISLKNNGIEKLRDLIGRKVMVTNDALLSAEIIGMFKANGVFPHDIYRQKHSYNLDDLINKNTDAMASYISNEPYVLDEKGVEYVAFHPKDYGQEYYGDMLFTSKRTLVEKRRTVKAFVEASLKGWAYAFKHIPETAYLIKSKYNTQDKTLQNLIFEGQALRKLALIDGVPLGHIDLEKIKRIAELYYNHGVVDHYDGLNEFIFRP